jgi:hypothetical protein
MVVKEGQTEAPFDTATAYGVTNGERLNARHQHFGDPWRGWHRGRIGDA